MKNAVGLVLLLLAAPLAAQDDPYAFDLADGQRKLLKGNLSAAAAMFDEILLADEEEVGADRPAAEIVAKARIGLWEIDLRRGKYEEVLQQLEAQPPELRELRPALLLRARALAALGRYEDAIVALQGLAGNEEDFEARWRLGQMLAELGRRQEARAQWQAVVDYANTHSVRDGLLLAWLGRCLHSLGGRENIEAASAFLVESMRLLPERPEARTTYGILEFEVYGEAAGFPSGERNLKKVLENNGDIEEALLALYRIRRNNFQLDPAKTGRFLDRVLELNPRSVPALVERAQGVIDDRRFEDGAEILDRALTINPRHKPALAHRAAVAYLQNDADAYGRFRDRALAIDPGFVEVDRVLADHLVALYRFSDAIPFYEKVRDSAPDSVPNLHGLAKALIYTGRGSEAAEVLRKAADLQPGFVNPWRNNALAVQDLLGEEYTTVERGGFEITMHRDDVAVLQEYLVPLHLEAAEVLGRKYDYRPDRPVKVEVFHTWDDFSVRTIGFRGFTALGACFGPFITLVSPVDADLRRQEFMWAATVWHEYAHVLTLGLSRHRVPRWLTEGISVYEERQRDPSWERGMDRELFDAFHNKDIPPVRLMNSLFRGPRILFGYFQGGLIVQHIADRYGFDKVLAMLRGYGQDLSAEEVFRRSLGMSSSQFDREFLDWIEKEKLRGMKLVPRFDDRGIQRLLGRLGRDPDNLQARVDLAWAFAQRDNPVDAGRHLAEALRRKADYGPALLLHAELLRRRGELDAAAAAYAAGFGSGAEDFDSRIRYGRLLEARGDLQGAMDQYQRAKACWPGCTEQDKAPELLLARVLRQLDRKTEAMMELKTYCRRTGRAFRPRLELAEFEREQGNREAEARFLEDCIRIDPFMRRLHLELADAWLALDKKSAAVRELEVALAVPPQLDRAYLGQAQPPDPTSPEEKAIRGELCVRIARLHKDLGDDEAAVRFLRRAGQEAPGSDAAREAQRLLELWGR